jgi:hypothetical protein
VWSLNGSFIALKMFGCRGDPLRFPRDILYPLKLALTSPTSGGRSVGIVRLRTTDHRVCLFQMLQRVMDIESKSDPFNRPLYGLKISRLLLEIYTLPFEFNLYSHGRVVIFFCTLSLKL